MADTPVLATTKYTEPSVYLGEIVAPEATNLSADARIPAIVAKGDRLAIARNQPIRRGFILGEQLIVSPVTPHTANLATIAKGEVGPPNRLYKADGTDVAPDKWRYVDTGGEFLSVQIADDAYESTATYFIDYQSNSREVRDLLPIPQIRQLRAVGNQIDRAQYAEYRDYYIPTDFVAPIADTDNANNESDVSPITSTLQPASTGGVSFNSLTEFAHQYTRGYTVTCVAIAGVSPNRTATFEWEADILTNAEGAAAPVPLCQFDPKPQFTIDEATPASLVQSLELGIVLDLAFGGTNFVVGDVFTFAGLGPALVEIDSRYGNAQYATVSDPVVISGTPNDLQIFTNAGSAYSLSRNNKYQLKLAQTAGASPNRQLTFVWGRFGDNFPAGNTFTVLENNFNTHIVNLANGVKVDFLFGTNDAIDGTIWEITAKAPRIYYTGKDSREYKLNVGVLTNPAPGTYSVTGSYTTNTTEGKFGTFAASQDDTDASPDGYTVLADNVSLAFRNISRFAALDLFSFSVLVREEIDWSLTSKVEDVKEVTDYQTDLNGNITGTAGLKYITLSSLPTEGSSIRVQNINTQADISFNYVVGTPFIFFNINPNVGLRVSYETRGQEPDPGQIYYVSAAFLRPQEFYNAPFLALRLEDGRNFAAPSTINNDLYIGNEVAWDNGTQATYLVQPENKDGSGTYTALDYKDAIRSLRDAPRGTDVCLLNFNAALSDVLAENIIANDPFEKRANLVWVGMPIGTPIGDDNVDNSLVFTAKRTLQVAGTSAAKGTRILIGNNKATKDIRLDSGQVTTVTLDGSFLALAGAARVAGFADPATDILRTAVNGFKTIDIYRDEENKLLGAAQIVYIKGAPGAYYWAEDTTVDTTRNFDRIQLMTQRQFVTKIVVRELDRLIGITPASGAAGKQLVKGLLASVLRGLLGRGLIGTYQDDNGNERQFNPDADIVVFIDKNDSSLYYYNFAWFSRNVIKRLFGLYALNSNDFSVGTPLT